MNVTEHVELFVQRANYEVLNQSLQTAIWKMARIESGADLFSGDDLQIKDDKLKTVSDYVDSLSLSGYLSPLNIFRSLHCKKIFERGSEYYAPVLIYGLGEEKTENPNATWKGPESLPPKISQNIIVIVLKKDGFHLSFLSEEGFDRVDEIYNAMLQDLAIPEMQKDDWLRDPNTNYFRCDRYVNGLLWNTSIYDRLVLKTKEEIMDLVLDEFRVSSMYITSNDNLFDRVYPQDIDELSPQPSYVYSNFQIEAKTKFGKTLLAVMALKREPDEPQPFFFVAMIKQHYWSLLVEKLLKSH